jgi:murein DD-endopeptidase MepM/ murein hydrolase activator NlpD
MSRSRSRHRRWRRLFAALVAACVVVPLAPLPVAAGRGVPATGSAGRSLHATGWAGRSLHATGSAGSLRFAPPVDAPVSDGFRPPADPYGPGNRGWQFATAPGDVVSAAGDGTVSFAGPVGGSAAVTLTHVGGLRTTYSYLETVDVTEGDRVALGWRVGTAGEGFHFGVLLDGEYVDPAVLFRAGALRLGARLVAVG